jgi:5-methylcytosine-specific restriction endonuclease McrBC regulatory subunit McrC
MRTTDNSKIRVSEYHDQPEVVVDDLKMHIANKKISDLVKSNPDLLIYPLSIGDNNDGNESGYICELQENTLITNNIMGFIGVNDTRLTISSRFYQDGNDYFLHYMLQKVFLLNIFDLKHSQDKESIWDFLLYLFPYYLKKAINQGLYKEYTHRKYNDPNVKGSIDVTRHIRYNYPFVGNIAYSTREHSYDNPVTQLIRHTIEYIRSHQFGRNILSSDTDTKTAVNQIVSATGTYNKNDRLSVINENLKPFRHPYFTEYKELQKISLMILRREKLTFGKEKDKVYGLLFDGSWLWEEYLNTILRKEKFIHPQNKIGFQACYLFTNNRYSRYPDFYNEKIVLDAKYKHLEHNKEIDRNDMHQIIAYMHFLRLNSGGFVYPFSEIKTEIQTMNHRKTIW